MYIILAFIVGFILCSSILYPKVKAAKKIDEETQAKNEEIKKQHNDLELQYAVLKEKKEQILLSIQELKDQFAQTKQEAEINANEILKKNTELIGERIDQAAIQMSEKYQKASEKAEKDYLETLSECAEDFQQQLSCKQLQLAKVQEELDDLTQKLNSAVEANKRAEEIRVKQDFYRLQLNKIDIDEIARLREVTPYLRDSEPLNKVIWKVYYENAYTDLIGRVVGTGVHTGIYKITNIKNQMCYVGQAANIADRWKQHIKRGIGADAPTRNKLYPAMLEFGVENFTFEIVEECDRSKLNEREDYWQEYFKAKEFGYSIK